MVAGRAAVDVRRLGRRDRAWRAVPVEKVVEAITPPGADRIRARLTDWIAAHPRDPRIRLLDIDTGHTGGVLPAERADFVRALVVASDAPCPAVGSGSADLDGLPFRLTVGRDWAHLRHSHALGDGASTWQFLGMLLTEQDPPAARTPAPLQRALLRTFGRVPRLWRAIALYRELESGRAPAEPRNMLCPYDSGYSFATSTAVSSADFGALVRGFRGERESTASVMAIMTLRALLLCRHHGLAVDDRVAFMVDLRRYLPATPAVEGNFSWSKSVPVRDSDTPAQLGARIARIVATGLPLLVYSRDVLRRSLIRTGRMSPAPAPTGATVRLMISYATRWTTTPPPAGAATPRIAVAIAPPGPGFVGFNVIEAYGRIHASLNWCSASLDPVRAARIAADFVADPGTGPVDAALWDRGRFEPRDPSPAPG
ncbi:hypothetical protein EBN03_09105 [Nocardia stercoris]|uniref:Diacylglycerol O-acyltransferase n=2 Tax=Nocardia stercoris TaxID=2483361 RepID=A0A3M2L9D2_9NOCA|nr:hypothetical protein EBN03_09105 [Nocardia stercoris]